MDDHLMERNLNSSGGCTIHCTMAMLASEKPSVSPSAFTFAKGVASAFQMCEFITLSVSSEIKLKSVKYVNDRQEGTF